MRKNLDGTWVNPNQYTIGIELAAGYDVDQDGAVEPSENDITEWQYQQLTELVKAFANNPDTAFVLDEKNIIIHGDITDYKEKPEKVRAELLKRLFPVQSIDKEAIKSQIISLLNQL
jgi:N-acetyl-anhydromuramyl-L-alanine amidase AmpD